MAEPALRVVLLAGDRESTPMVYHGIREACRVVGVVLEPAPPRGALIKRRLKRLGWRRTAGQLAFFALNRLMALGASRRKRELIGRLGLSTEPIPETLITRVQGMNAPEVARLLQEWKPDAVVINGTRILAPRILNAVPAPFLNTHMGMTPRYRGVHGGYWALATGDPEHCGVTVHLVDEGIDTGDVLYQRRVTVEPEDSFNTYPLHQLAAALPDLRRALSDVARGEPAPVPGVGPSKLWFHPTLGEYLKARITRGVK